MTNKEWAAQLAQAKDIAGNAMEALDLADALPAHANPIAREAMLTLLQMLATDMTDRARLGVIKTLLEYNLAPPAAVLNQRITSAEDLIDALVPEGVLRGETIPSSPVAS